MYKDAFDTANSSTNNSDQLLIFFINYVCFKFSDFFCRKICHISLIKNHFFQLLY